MRHTYLYRRTDDAYSDYLVQQQAIVLEVLEAVRRVYLIYRVVVKR
jgi:hypothetical protein